MNVVSMFVEFNTIIIIDEGLYVCFCSSCKAQCAHPSEARYSAIKITLIIIIILLLLIIIIVVVVVVDVENCRNGSRAVIDD